MFATGYKFSFPFLVSDVIPVSQNKASLYKNVFPPELDRPTLAVIGLVQPLGSTLPISEMQARWAVNVFKGNTGCLLINKNVPEFLFLIVTYCSLAFPSQQVLSTFPQLLLCATILTARKRIWQKGRKFKIARLGFYPASTVSCAKSSVLECLYQVRRQSETHHPG